MMKKITLALMFSSILAYSQFSSAHCRQTSTVTAPALAFDLSTELTSTSTQVSKNSRTIYPGTFTCTARGLLFPNSIGIASPFQGRTATIGFNGGKQFVSITVTALEKDRVIGLTEGVHQGSELDTNFTVQFNLLATKPGTNYVEVSGSTATVTPIVLASDASSLGILQWLLDIVSKLVTFLLTLQWPTSADDIYLQPITLTYNPILTTCNFVNQGLVVSLPPVSINAVKTATRAGYTPFTLNFTCQDFLAGGNASRDVSIFLSSSNLLSNDKATLNNTISQGAKGVGFRLVSASNLNTPLVLSDSVAAKNGATNIFTVLKGNPISPSFSVNLGAYYYAYNTNSVTQGQVSSTATVVMSYN
ncbi:fimbrial protein [Providencia rettgeri]|nr:MULTISPECIES: fimbrial protein [Providencia]WIE09667.1 fimbrial protein [Providencia rettgeri]